MLLLGPPTIPAERLFRILLRAPRASLPIEVPLGGAPPGAFRVCAIHPLEEAEVLDEAAALPPGARAGHVGVGLTALALHQDGERVFADGAELARLLREDEADRLVGAVLEVLHVCSPSARRIDYGAWLQRVARGARKHPGLAVPLAEAVDGDILKGAPRPDRFFGVPMAELTDGQWLAYRAARFAFL